MMTSEKNFNKSSNNVRYFSHDDFGLSLVELMLSMGFASFIILILSAHLQNVKFSENRIKDSTEISNYRKVVYKIINQRNGCESAFLGKKGKPITFDGSNTSIASLNFTDSHGRVEKVMSVNESFGHASIIKQIQLTKAPGYPIITGESAKGAVNKYVANLSFLTRQKNGSSELNKSYAVEMKIASRTDNHQIVSCELTDSVNKAVHCSDFEGVYDPTHDQCQQDPITKKLGKCSDGEYLIGFDPRTGTKICHPLPQPSIPDPQVLDFGFNWTMDKKTADCGSDQAITQFDCTGSCGSKKMRVGCHGLPPQKMGNEDFITADAKSADCPHGYAMSGFDCTGDCGGKKMRAHCRTLQGINSDDTRFTPEDRQGRCPDSYVACGFDCGGNCGSSRMKIRCCRFNNN